MLEVENLSVEVGDREVIHAIPELEGLAVIVRGFLSVDIEGLPPELSAQMQRAIELSEQEFL